MLSLSARGCLVPPLICGPVFGGTNITSVPAWLIVLVPDEEARLQVHLTHLVGVSLDVERVLAWVIDRKFVVNLLIKSASEDQVVVLELMLGVAAYVGLIRMELAIQKGKLFAHREEVALGPHAKPNLRIVVNQRVPGVSRHNDFTRRCTLCALAVRGALFGSTLGGRSGFVPIRVRCSLGSINHHMNAWLLVGLLDVKRGFLHLNRGRDRGLVSALVCLVALHLVLLRLVGCHDVETGA